MHILIHKVHEFDSATDICENDLVVVTSIKGVTSEKDALLLRVTIVSEGVQRRSPKSPPTFLETGRHSRRFFNRNRQTTDRQNSTEAEQSKWTGARIMYCLTPKDNKHNCIISRNK
jgi:hypothetical protein